MLAAGQISELEVHPVYPIEVNGHKIGRYTADFRYKDQHGNVIVEDVKGGRDSDPHMRYVRFRIKLVYALYGQEITLVHP